MPDLQSYLPTDADRNADILASAEANPNTKLIPQNYEQQIAIGGGSPVGLNAQDAGTAPKPVPTPLQKFVPTYDANGNVTGSKPAEPGGLQPNGPVLDSTKQLLSNLSARDPGPAEVPFKPAPAPEPTGPALADTKRILANLAARDAAPTKLASYAGGGGGAPFDPFKGEKDVLEASKRNVVNEAAGLDVASRDRDKGFTSAEEENAKFADTIKRLREEADAKGERMLGEHQKLVHDEASRNYEKEFFAQKNVAQHMADFIGAASGGFLQGFRGLPSNPYLDQQNKQVDRYIANAKANSTLKIGESKDLYNHFLDKTKNDAEAAALVHKTVLEGARTQVEKAAAETDDVEKRANLADQATKIDLQIKVYDRMAAEARQRAAAAAAAANDPVRLAKEMQGLEQGAANIAHTRGETAKLATETAAAPKLTDEQKAQREVDANLQSIEAAKKNVDDLTRGSAIGGMAAEHLPGWVPGVSDAKAAMADRDSYNNRTKASIAAAYKLSTDANEPKNLALIEEYSRPYEIQRGDDSADALRRMNLLEQFITESGAAKGATAPASSKTSLSNYAKPNPPGFGKVPGT